MYVCVATGELIHPCHYEEDFKPDALVSQPPDDPTPTPLPPQVQEAQE